MLLGHNAIAVANIFVEKSYSEPSPLGPMTVMSLLKYVYFSHGWTLGRTGKPLINDEIQAWRYGPVVPSIYYKFADQGIYIREKAKSSFFRKATASLSDEEWRIVNKVYSQYSQVSALRLTAVSNKEGSPWHKYRHAHYARIPNETIRQFYANLEKEQNKNFNPIAVPA